MKIRSFICLVILWSFIISTVAGTAGAVRLVATTMSKDVTEGLQPIGVTDTFPSNTRAFHAIIIIDGASSKDVAKGVWVSVDAIDRPNYEIASAELKMKEGSNRLHFQLYNDRPGFRWPIGNYRLDVYVNDTFVVSVPFKVVEAVSGHSGTTTPKGSSPPASGTGIIGNWTCQVSNGGKMLGTGSIVFDASGMVMIGQRRFSYKIQGNVIRIIDQTGASDYTYQLSGNTLVMKYTDGTVFQCSRNTKAGPVFPGMRPGQMMPQGGGMFGGGGMPGMQPTGNEWQLNGYFCSYGGASSYTGEGYSSFSHMEWIRFDGRGNWAYGSEGSYTAPGAGFYSGSQGAEMIGIYRIKGNQIFYQSSTGEQGVAQVHMRQPDGTITEIMVDGNLFAKGLCDM